jgi:hypothetical protein
MVKNTYQTLKDLENFNFLISKGIIKMIVYDWLVMYEFFLEERKSLDKMMAYENTAENYKCSTRQIMNLVKWMEN